MVFDIVLFVVGIALVVIVLVDLASTTISLSAVRGPLSTRMSRLVWNLARFTEGTRLAFLRRWTGPLLIVVIAVGWLFALTLGWSFVFSMDGALSKSAEPGQQTNAIRWIDAVFFVFGSLIGRGSAGLAPDQVVWSSLVAVMTLTGVALLTLALAWILPVVAAVVQKRSLAAKLSALGGTPQDIILRSWTGRDLGNLDLHLLPLIDEFILLAQRHLAYPVIHYFHSADDRTATGPRVAALDEALTIIEAAGLDDLERETGLDRSVTRPLRQAISDYLSTLEYIFIKTAGTAPLPPTAERIIAEGLAEPDVDERIVAICSQYQDRRALLAGYVHHDGYHWEDVTSGAEAETEEPDHTA